MLVPKVVIVVEGGVVQNVMANTSIDVMLKDFDNIAAGHKLDPIAFDFQVGVYSEAALYEAIIEDVAEDMLIPSQPPTNQHPSVNLASYDFKPGTYRHFKGGYYKALFLALDTTNDQPVVVYISLANGNMHTRPLTNWLDRVYYPDDATNRFVPRFELVPVDAIQPLPPAETAHSRFHALWTAAVGTPNYNKAEWGRIEWQLKQAGLI
jgi:hypothetical protein